MIDRTIPAAAFAASLPLPEPPRSSIDMRRLDALLALEVTETEAIGNAVAAAPLRTPCSQEEILASAKVLREFGKALAARCARLWMDQAYRADGDVSVERKVIVDTIDALEAARHILRECDQEANP